MSELSIATEVVDPSTTLVAVSGDVTFGNAEQLARELHAALGSGAERLIVDVSEVGFMDSSGLSALLRAATTAHRNDGAVLLVHTPDGPPNILRFKGVERLLRMLPSRAAALAG